MLTNDKLRTAVRRALGGAGALTVAYAPFAVAQNAPNTQNQNALEEVVVTGSRIPRADIASASPVSVVNRDAIQLTGLTDVGNLIQRMPSMSGSPIGTTTNNGGDGSVHIDLRGMGPQRTITLVDGKRLLPTWGGGLGGSDYQSVPQEMIDHIEVLKAGASAIYGADAVAGVVNIITRKDYDGIDVNVQNADFFNMKAGRQYNVGLIAGKTFTGGNFVFGAEYVNQDGAYQSDAPWDFFQNSYYIYPQGCQNQLTAPYNGTPQGGCYVAGSSRIPEGRLTFANEGANLPYPGTYMNAGNGLVPYDGRVYNYAPVNYIQTPYQRTNVFAEANFDLTDHIRFNASLHGTYRTSKQNGAPQPYDSRFDPAYNGTYVDTATGQTMPYSGISPDNYYLVQAATAAGLTPEPVIDARRRMVEIPRIFTQDVTSYRFVTGLSGDLGNVSWSAFWNRGYRSAAYHDYGQFFGPFLTNAMGPSAIGSDGQLHCYTDINDSSTLISGCVPFDFFGGPGSVTQAMLDYVGADLNDTRTYRQDEISVSFNGTAWKLPGGNLGWAAGAGYLGDSQVYVPDSGKQKGQVTGNKTLGTDGAVYSHNVFGEIYAPLLDNGRQAFDLRLGVRYDDYNLFGSDSTWQLGLQFQAIPSLKLRATTGSVFRAPSINELFDGQQDDFPSYSDPCIPTTGPLPPGCAQVGVQTDTQVLSRIGGNPNLQPETGDTLSGGIVFTPNFRNGDFSLTVDYWRIKLKNGISSLGVQLILDNCYLNQDAQACSLITRRANYSVAKIIDTNLNVSDEAAKGIDTEMRYSFNLGVGEFQTSFLWSHLLERTKVAAAGQPTIDLSGRFTDPTSTDGGAYPTNKINYTFQWHRNDLTLGYLGEYIGSLKGDTFFFGTDYIQHIGAQLYHDIVMTYDFKTGTQLSAGITNVTNEPPPFIDFGFNAKTDPSTYRMFGRGYYLRVSHKF
jgi:outer membrane receptor protein involved in Fe transport